MIDSTLMMSQELNGMIPDLEDQVANFPIIVCKILGKEHEFESRLLSLLVSTPHKVEFVSSIRDALEILKNKTELTFEEIKIIHLETTTSLGGPFVIGDVGLKDIDHIEQKCSLCLELHLDSNKEVIF